MREEPDVRPLHQVALAAALFFAGLPQPSRRLPACHGEGPSHIRTSFSLLPALTIISSSLAVRKEPLTKGGGRSWETGRMSRCSSGGVEPWNKWRLREP